MSSPFEEVLNDLEDEQRALEQVLEKLSPEQFELPTHAPGWLVRDQIAHLAQFDEAARQAIVDPAAFEEEARRPRVPAGDENHYLVRARKLPVSDLKDWWKSAGSTLIDAARASDPSVRLPWYGPSMSAVAFLTARLMETWSHGLDVVDVVGIDRPDTDRLRHVAFLGVRTRPFSYSNRGIEVDNTPVSVELVAPSGATWQLGEPSDTNTVRGTATDFCRVVTQRRHLADTKLEVVGDAACEWMAIAQAFAGPPGQGRQPGEFSDEG